jgi:translation initiation factor IF-3
MNVTRNSPRSDEPRVNNQIRADKIRVIDANGEMLGVMSVPEALRKAEAAGLDLVEVSPNAAPPVCKILDYGKYKYELQKKASEARKKQKVITLKEIKLRPGIDDHDFEVKMKQVHKFLHEGDKVKITLRFRGREMTHMELGMEVMTRVKAHVTEVAKVETEPKMEGRQAIMILSPAK